MDFYDTLARYKAADAAASQVEPVPAPSTPRDISMDIAELTNAPSEMTLAGSTYRVRALKAREWGELHAWLKKKSEGPLTVALRLIADAKAAKAPLDIHQERYLLDQARASARDWPPRIGSPAWFEAIGDTEGGDQRFLLAVLQAEQAGTTPEDIALLVDRISPDESRALMLTALGIEPSPKDPGSVATSPTTPTTTNLIDPPATTGPAPSIA